MAIVVSKRHLSQNVVQLEIEAPRIAKKHKAGHFVIVKKGTGGERIPLTIARSDPDKGTITLVIQVVGVSSYKLSTLKPDDEVTDLVGPLGNATHVSKVGTVLCAGGGVGIAPLLPIAEAMHKAGNRVISVIAARNRDMLILEEQIAECSDMVMVMTDDGSYGQQGLITAGMQQVIDQVNIDQAIVIGPAVMMKYASMLTSKYDIPTLVSLNSIMIDGTGMCGGCRVSVKGESKFVCVDGPEFNARDIDFDELLMRLNSYKDEENQSYQRILYTNQSNGHTYAEY